MKATVERNKETGEFSCMVDGNALLKAKVASGIKRVYDMQEAINMGALPEVLTDGRGDAREFEVRLGEFVVASGLGAVKAYRMLDELEAALLPAPDISGAGSGLVAMQEDDEAWRAERAPE